MRPYPSTNEQNVSAAFEAVGTRVVALAASTGGLDAVSLILAALPEGFPAAVLVVQHLSPDFRSLLAEVLGGRTRLPVAEARGGERLRPGTVLVAPPGRHLVATAGGGLALSNGPKVSFVRPSATVLFESLALHVGSGVVAVVLTGGLGDGAAALGAVRRAGGTTIAQERATARASSMPEAAVRTGEVDLELPLSDIPAALVRLAGAA